MSINFESNLKHNSMVIVYNIHSFYNQERFFIFTRNFIKNNKFKFTILNGSLDSITDLFQSAN